MDAPSYLDDPGKKHLYSHAITDQLQLAECLFFLFSNTQILPTELVLLCKCVV